MEGEVLAAPSRVCFDEAALLPVADGGAFTTPLGGVVRCGSDGDDVADCGRYDVDMTATL